MSLLPAEGFLLRKQQTDNLRCVVEQLKPESRAAAPTVAYMPGFLVQTCLPHRDPGQIPVWTRENGHCRLSVQPLFENGWHGLVNYGIPYGSLPRLIISFIETEVIVKERPVIELGDCLSAFMEQVGVVSKRGKNGTNQRLREQMKRLVTARFVYTNDLVKHNGFQQFTLVSKSDTFWKDSTHGEWAPTLTLTAEAFANLSSRGIPLNLHSLRAMIKSPLELDLYAWLTSRLYRLKKPSEPIPYDRLAFQFGSEYGRPRDFKVKFHQALRNVLKEYRDAKIEVDQNGIILLPSKPHVKPTKSLPKPY